MTKRLAILAMITLTFAGFAAAQEADPWEPSFDYSTPTQEVTPEPTPECDHTSNSAERFEHVRLLPPLKIKNFDPRRIEYLFEDKVGIHVGSLTADTATVMPKDIWKEYKSRWYWILYCDRDGYAYTIVEVAPGQMQTAKADSSPTLKRLKP
jgi:hypothetical protein